MIVTHRPVTPEDEDFIKSLIVGIAAEELQASLWPEDMRGPLLDMQYRGRIGSIRGNYSNRNERILLADEAPAGWIAVDRPWDAVWLLEIVILPEYRSQGLGTQAICEILNEGQGRGLPVRLHVNVGNRALHLYERLGFRRVGGNEVQHLMEFNSSAEKLPAAR